MQSRRSTLRGLLGLSCALGLSGLAPRAAVAQTSSVQDEGDFSKPPRGVRGTVGLVVSGGTNKSVEELESAIVQSGQYIIPNTRLMNDLDPVYMHARLLALLKDQYPNIRLFSSVSNASRSGSGLIVVVDAKADIGKLSGQTTTVQITLNFRDGRGKSVARISGVGTGVIPYPAWDVRLQQAADGALAQIAQKL